MREPIFVLGASHREEYAFYTLGEHETVKTEQEAFERFNLFGGEIVFRDCLDTCHILTTESDLEKIEDMGKEFFGETKNSVILFEGKDDAIVAAYAFWNIPSNAHVINVMNKERKLHCIDELHKINMR